jgi:hypothetical protein
MTPRLPLIRQCRSRASSLAAVPAGRPTTLSLLSVRRHTIGNGRPSQASANEIRGVTKSVALEVEFHGVSKNPYGKTVTGLNATGTINRKDFGVAFNAVLETGGVAVGEKVKLELDIEAIWAE